MLFSPPEIQKLKTLLLSPADSNKAVALGMIQGSVENVPILKETLCIVAYLSNEASFEVQESAHNLLIENLLEEDLVLLQNQMIILDYAQYKFKVTEGWNSYKNPLRHFLKQHEEVLDVYLPLFKINPEPFAQMYSLLAHRIQKEWKNYQKALFFYEKAIELNPNNSQATFGFAMIVHTYYIKKGKRLEDVDKVLEYYINAYKSPKNINAYKNAAMLCKDIGDAKRSAYYYEEGLKRCPEDSSLLNNYANLLMKFMGDYPTAKKLAEKGLSIAPTDASLLDTLAHIQFQGFKNYKQAEMLFSKALKKDGQHHYSYTGLGDMYVEMGQYQLAEEYYQKGLHNGLQYSSREVSEVIEKLEKLVVLYRDCLHNESKADFYAQKIFRLKHK